MSIVTIKLKWVGEVSVDSEEGLGNVNLAGDTIQTWNEELRIYIINTFYIMALFISEYEKINQVIRRLYKSVTETN